MQTSLPVDWLDDKASKRRYPLPWPVVIALVWLVYELTSEAKLSVVLGCVKFGWSDFVTAFWLRRMDANRSRGRSCFWFYLASGLWKVALTGFVAIFGVIALYAVLHPGRRGGVPGEALESLLVAIVGFGFYSLTLYWGVLVSLATGSRVWISSDVHQSRRDGQFPPSGSDGNQAEFLIIMSLFLPALTLIVIGPLLTFLLGRAAGLLPVVGAANPMLAVCAYVGLVIGFAVLGIIFVVVVKDLISARVTAQSPADCWRRS